MDEETRRIIVGVRLEKCKERFVTRMEQYMREVSAAE